MRPVTVGSIVAAGCVIVAVACFSERGAGPTVSGAVQCQVPVTVIDSMHYIVAIRDFGFHPDSISVPVGATPCPWGPWQAVQVRNVAAPRAASPTGLP